MSFQIDLSNLHYWLYMFSQFVIMILPAFIAFERKHSNKIIILTIIMFHLFFPQSIIIWLALIIWACSEE